MEADGEITDKRRATRGQMALPATVLVEMMSGPQVAERTPDRAHLLRLHQTAVHRQLGFANRAEARVMHMTLEGTG